jgi:hypothetical protein
MNSPFFHTFGEIFIVLTSFAAISAYVSLFCFRNE